MPISRKLFDEIREKHGDCGSWAIWQEPNRHTAKKKDIVSNEAPKKLKSMDIEEPFDVFGTGTASGMKDDIFQDVSDEILNQLNPKYVLVALNFSKPCKKCKNPSIINKKCNDHKVVETLMNFHSGDGNIGKLRYAIRKSPLAGAYITDIIKNYPNANSKEVIKKCREDPEFEKKNVDWFLQEIQDLRTSDQIIIALGDPVEEILQRHDIKHTKIRHYSYRYNKKNWGIEEGEGLAGYFHKDTIMPVLVKELGFKPW